jgi:hypothetical protein
MVIWWKIDHGSNQNGDILREKDTLRGWGWWVGSVDFHIRFSADSADGETQLGSPMGYRNWSIPLVLFLFS